jgi:phage-related protein
MPNPTVTLPPTWVSPAETEVKVAIASLGDGYDVLMPIGTIGVDEIWQIESSHLNQTQATNMVALFRQLAGVDAFDWSPSGEPPLKEYVCTSWDVRRITVGYWRLSAKFESLRG